MTDFDPTDPWGQKSPWDVAQPNQPTAPEAPVTNQPVAATAPNPFKIGLTLKAASGYDAEWITPTVYGGTADEVASRTMELLTALKQYKIIETTAQAAEFTRGQFLGGGKSQPAASQPSFNPASGQVQYNQAPAAPAASDRPANVPANYTYKEGTSKNGKPYKGWFPPRGVDGSPIWVS